MEEKKPKPKGNAGSKILIVILLAILGIFLLVLSLVVGGIIGYYFAVNNTINDAISVVEEIDDTPGVIEEIDDEDPGSETGQVPEEQPAPAEKPGKSKYNGKNIKAELPEGWKIDVEVDGAGSDMLVPGVDYEGVTALTVKNPNGKWLFKLYGVSGIGGIGACEEYFKFADDSAAYLQEKKDKSKFVLEEELTVYDYSNSDYSEFYIFDLRARRLGHKLFWDTVDGNQFFEAGCGISYSFIPLSEIKFDETNDVSAYGWDINEEASEAELKLLDDVLESLEAAD
ncbi:hypothetical protein GF357_02680 [Candidatus Dojkabacteria bacterium]|nr:hypothetical protein [Candidatus Dojkabacteria bacterium]